MFRDFDSTVIKLGSSSIHALSIHVESDEKSPIEQFGNNSLKKSDWKQIISNEQSL